MRILAYIDPGTGSLFIQIVAGGLLAVGVTFRGVFRGFFSRLKKSNSAKQTLADDEEN